MRGDFIVFEGPDGSGTSTQASMLAGRLSEEGREVVGTSEPTDGQYGRRIRGEMKGESKLSAMELQQLFCSDRAEHVGNIILPNLRNGATVISDRYVLSTMIYGEEVGVSRAVLEKWNSGFPQPDCVVITLPPLNVCLERLKARERRDAFEKEEFVKRIYDRYAEYARNHPDVIVIDTLDDKRNSADKVYAMVRSCLRSF